MEFENQNIKCSTFQEAETIIKKAEDKIKATKNMKEKQYFVQDILLEVESLMSCANYNGKNQDCLNCHLALLNYIREYKPLAENKQTPKMFLTNFLQHNGF